MNTLVQPTVKIFSKVHVRGWFCEVIGINRGGVVVQVIQPPKLKGTVFTANFKEVK